MLVWAGLMLLVLTLSRMLLLVLYADLLAPGETAWVLLQGIRIDLLSLAYLLLVPVALVLLRPEPVMRLIIPLLAVLTGLMVLLEAATPSYASHFAGRPGRIFFEYLPYPGEVGAMLLADFKLELVLVLFCTLMLGWLSFLLVRRLSLRASPWSLQTRLLVLPVAMLLLFIAGRSSFDHRPVNPSSVSFSSSQLANELPLNSTYTLLYALYRMKDETDLAAYPDMAEAEVFSRIRSMTGQEQMLLPDLPTLRTFRHAAPARPRNLVIVVQESLGAQFVGALGGQPLTPNLDATREQGLWFDRLYATGIRSARGLEAIVTGFPPSPARSVLKLGLAQGNFYTLAQTLAELNYHNFFVYGGESHFDNMAGFFLANGFDQVIDEKDYDADVFRSSWGVADEALYEKALDLFAQQQGPFFGLVFTSSFHSPFEIPAGRLAAEDDGLTPKQKAVKYADWALGRFLRDLASMPYGSNTLVLVVADHDERIRGANLVPVSNFHIPGVFLGAAVPRRIVTQPVSQLDLVPTTLALMGISATVPAIGRNLLTLSADDPGWAVMQFGQNHGYLKGDQLVVHQPYETARQFEVTDAGLVAVMPVVESLEKDALALLHLPGLLYETQRYRSPQHRDCEEAHDCLSSATWLKTER